MLLATSGLIKPDITLVFHFSMATLWEVSLSSSACYGTVTDDIACSLISAIGWRQSL